MRLEDRLKEQARSLGFQLVGIAAAGPADDFSRLQTWLSQGFGGDMDYMKRHRDARRHPASILPEVRSVVMVGISYNSGDASTGGKVARYARGEDYHNVLRAKLKSLLRWVQDQVPGVRGRAVVDTAPLLERDFARRAGLGWIGKNTMLLNIRQGSYLFLAALLLDLELEPDSPFETAHCGTCTACLDACPTDAFAGAYRLDARRCISYLTIELRTEIPQDLRPLMGEWVFGCDVCQEVCPWNRKAPDGTEPAFQARNDLVAVDLGKWLSLSEDEFEARFGDTALTRPRRGGLLRNAAIALGNRGDPAALPALRKAAADHDPLVRDAAAWAIARIEALTCFGGEPLGNRAGEDVTPNR